MKLPDTLNTEDVFEMLYVAYAAGVAKKYGNYLSTGEAQNIIRGEEQEEEESEPYDEFGGSEGLARWQNRGGL